MTPGQYRGFIADVGFDGEGEKFHVKIAFNILQDLPITLEAFDKAFEANDLEALKNVDMNNMTPWTWYGYFKGGAKQITLDTLAKMGCKDFAKLADGKVGLDAERAYGLSLKENEYQGKKRIQISSIYIPGEGGAGVGKKLDRGAVIAQLAALGVTMTPSAPPLKEFDF